jgi:transposase
LGTPSSLLPTPIHVIVNKLSIWRGGLLGKTLFTAGFGGACRPLKFNISRNTINLWLQRKAETGDVQALPNRPPGNNHKITDWEQFRAFAKTHGDKTQVEMAQLWQGDISDRTISRALKKIGFTRKKRPTATSNGMSRNGKRS